MTRRIGLVRHAATSWTGQRYCGRSDPPLTPAGRLAAAALGEAIAAEVGRLGSGDRIVTSAARRAMDTAVAIADATGGPVVVDDRWREADCGAVEGLTFDALQAGWPALADRLLARSDAIDWPGGETAAALLERVTAAWEDVLEAADGCTVIVSHAGPLRIAAALAEGAAVAAAGFPAPATLTWVHPVTRPARARLAR